MKSVRLLSSMSLVLLACTPEPEGAMRIVLKAAPGVLSTHVIVKAHDQATRCLSLERAPLEVGVGQGTFPPVIAITATGFVDSKCTMQTTPIEQVSSDAARFRRGRVEQVELTLPSARVEANCADGVDDDSDGKVDCLDEDCEREHCSTDQICVENEVCRSGVCGQGSTVQCTSPPTCFASAGVCAAPGGCPWKPTPNVVCNDNDPCTKNEQCTAGGVCVGTPLSCTTPPGQCWATTGVCRSDAGCMYQPSSSGAQCNDADSCSLRDVCDGDGGCAGEKIVCEASECRTHRGCTTDGGCVFDVFDAGLPCGDAGVCNTQGGCMPAFPYAPSNVALTEIPTFPRAAVELGCGETIIDTGAADAGPTLTNWCTGQPEPAWNVIAQPSGPRALVLSVASLTVQAGATLKFVGARPVILVVNGPVTVLGNIIALGGAQLCVGTGAGNAPSGPGNGGSAGGSFGSLGGFGGAGSVLGVDNTGGAVGRTEGNELLLPLRGGCPGGIASAIRPSSGGGALQISAAGTVSIAGVVRAPGLGGSAGGGTLGGSFPATAGTGAGSGGAILIEGLSVTVSGTGAVVANGGGGGQGGGVSNGSPGADGARTGGSGGSAMAVGGASGGNGADEAAQATSGGDGATTAGGGGGGGYGRIRFNSVLGCSLGPAGMTGIALSPRPTSNKTDAGCP